jgi:hypothetical protein
MSDKCDCISAAHDCRKAENCRVAARFPDTIQIPIAEYEKLKADAERWRKCKTMNKQWWLDAMAEAASKGGRSLDEAIDAAIVRRVLDEKGE